MTSAPRAWLPSYLLLALIWGNSFVFIKVGLGSLTPAGVVLSRLALGTVTMVVISLIMRSPLPPRRLWGPLFIAALLMTSAGWFMFAVSEQYISSALAGIMNGATPLMTLLVILLAFPEEKPTRQRIVGLTIGFTGVVVVVGIWQGLGTTTWLGIGACILAVIGYGISYPYVRRHLATGRERPRADDVRHRPDDHGDAADRAGRRPDRLLSRAHHDVGRPGDAGARLPRQWHRVHPQLRRHPPVRRDHGEHRHLRHHPGRGGVGGGRPRRAHHVEPAGRRCPRRARRGHGSGPRAAAAIRRSADPSARMGGPWPPTRPTPTSSSSAPGPPGRPRLPGRPAPAST